MKARERETLRTALGIINPFALRTASGNLMVFKTPEECYQTCLQMLWAEFPRGFVDIPLFMVKYQDIKVREAEELCGRKQYALLRLWDSSCEIRKQKLREILSVLLKVSDVDFNESSFLSALQCLDIMLEKNGIAERTENGAIVEFINKKIKS